MDLWLKKLKLMKPFDVVRVPVEQIVATTPSETYLCGLKMDYSHLGLEQLQMVKAKLGPAVHAEIDEIIDKFLST